MQRIEHYLAEEEVPEWVSDFSASTDFPQTDGKIGFSSATFEWQAMPKTTPSEGFQLGPLDFIFPAGKISLISGATGSGKSAVLAALLGGEL